MDIEEEDSIYLFLFVYIYQNIYSTLSLPIHVILLELLIDPPSSIVFQRIKPLKEIMKEKPRDIKESILSSKNIISSI